MAPFIRRKQKNQSIATVFISGRSGTADDVHETPLTVFTDALEDSQAARSRNIADNISQGIVSKKEWGVSLGYGRLTNATKTLRKWWLAFLMSYGFTDRMLLLQKKASFNCNKVILFCDRWGSVAVTQFMSPLNECVWCWKTGNTRWPRVSTPYVSQKPFLFLKNSWTFGEISLAES